MRIEKASVRRRPGVVDSVGAQHVLAPDSAQPPPLAPAPQQPAGHDGDGAAAASTWSDYGPGSRGRRSAGAKVKVVKGAMVEAGHAERPGGLARSVAKLGHQGKTEVIDSV